jgi:hypothetical protein
MWLENRRNNINAEQQNKGIENKMWLENRRTTTSIAKTAEQGIENKMRLERKERAIQQNATSWCKTRTSKSRTSIENATEREEHEARQRGEERRMGMGRRGDRRGKNAVAEWREQSRETERRAMKTGNSSRQMADEWIAGWRLGAAADKCIETVEIWYCVVDCR